jgi:hypothetical protein
MPTIKQQFTKINLLQTLTPPTVALEVIFPVVEVKVGSLLVN